MCFLAVNQIFPDKVVWRGYCVLGTQLNYGRDCPLTLPRVREIHLSLAVRTSCLANLQSFAGHLEFLPDISLWNVWQYQIFRWTCLASPANFAYSASPSYAYIEALQILNLCPQRNVNSDMQTEPWHAPTLMPPLAPSAPWAPWPCVALQLHPVPLNVLERLWYGNYLERSLKTNVYFDMNFKFNASVLRILASYEAKTAKICNFRTIWPVIPLINHLFKFRQKRPLFRKVFVRL